MNTVHGAGCGKWVFGIANSATSLFSKIWAWWSNILNTYSRLFLRPPPSAGAHGNVCAKYVVFLPLYYYGSRVCH